MESKTEFKKLDARTRIPIDIRLVPVRSDKTFLETRKVIGIAVSVVEIATHVYYPEGNGDKLNKSESRLTLSIYNQFFVLDIRVTTYITEPARYSL